MITQQKPQVWPLVDLQRKLKVDSTGFGLGVYVEYFVQERPDVIFGRFKGDLRLMAGLPEDWFKGKTAIRPIEGV